MTTAQATVLGEALLLQRYDRGRGGRGLVLAGHLHRPWSFRVAYDLRQGGRGAMICDG